MLNVNYEQGLAQLRKLVLHQTPELLTDFSLFEFRLLEILQRMHRYGQSSNNDVEHNQVLDHLIQFTNEHFSLQFIDLCRSDSNRDESSPTAADHTSLPVQHTDLWKGGSEVLVQENRFMIYDPVERVWSSDQSALLQRARALEIRNQRMVQLKQVQVHRPTEPANAWKIAMEKEERLLDVLEQQTHAFPRCITFDHTSYSWTLISSVVSGQSWLDLFAAGKPTTLRSVRSLMKGAISLCEALKVLHAQRVAHRALTPERIVTLDDGRTMLQDTGLATWRYEPGEGSELYRAPEQAISTRSRTLPGPHTDIYQLGMILYHLMAGVVSGSPQALSLRVLNPAIPPEMDIIVQRALAHNVKERWRTISEMSSALKRLVR
jgi:Protein kinase domain